MILEGRFPGCGAVGYSVCSTLTLIHVRTDFLVFQGLGKFSEKVWACFYLECSAVGGDTVLC